MTELLTAAQMRAIEAAAISSGEVTGLELMERAGRGVVKAVFAEWPELQAGSFRAVVLCGPGNNGGDGFVVARLLKEWGWEVEVLLYGTPEGMPPDARVNYERWMGMGEVAILSHATWEESPFVGQSDVVIDALFGIGLARGIDLPLLALPAIIELGNTQKIVSIDVPSGLCADSGREIGTEVVVADLTVTFGWIKSGHVLEKGPENCGRLVVCDIGLPKRSPFDVLGRKYDVVSKMRADFSAILGMEDGDYLRPSGPGSRSTLDKGWYGNERNKFSHGHALILSGPPGHGGAARMSARGALRIGAGLVTVACAAEALAENAARLDAVMLKVVGEAAGLEVVLADDRINAVCVGPGLGLDAWGAELVRVVLKASEKVHSEHAPYRRVVLDADALTLISRDPALFALLHHGCVLTPHGGEFARLFPDIAARLDAPAVTGPAYSKVDATREAAARAGCVVLFKGADTVIAAADGQCSINSAAYDRAAPWLATAGSGDVLAGFICGLLARGFAPMQAAETAAWLHVECARSFGPGLIAEDLAEELPKVLRALGV